MDIYDLIIIGAGPVGLYASFMSGYLKINTLCIEADEFVGGQPAKLYPSKYIYDFPGYNEITGSELINKLNFQILQYKNYVKITTNTKIISYIYNNEKQYYELLDSNNNKYYSKFILITTGSGSFKINKLDENIKQNHDSIHYTLKDINHYNNKDVAVLGGGDGAIDYAIYLKKTTNANIHLIHRRNEITSNSYSIKDLMEKGINLYLNYNIKKIEKEYIHITHNDNMLNYQIKTDTILIQYGVKMDINKNPFINLKMHNNKFIVCSDNYQSSDENIYLAGACIYKENRINMIITGVSEATIALNHIKSRLPKTEKVIW